MPGTTSEGARERVAEDEREHGCTGLSAEVSDEALLGAMAVGDETAAVMFVRRYQRRVYGLAVATLGDSQSAEDVAQEAFLRIWRNAQIFDARKGSVSTWVLTITRNLVVDALRVRRMTPVDPSQLCEVGTGFLLGIDEDPPGGSDVTPEVRKALADLPAEQRRALVMAAIYGFTAAEISAYEGIPLGTAKTRIRSGLAKLRGAIGVEGPLA